MAPLLLWGGGAVLAALIMSGGKKAAGKYSIGLIVTDWPSDYDITEIDRAVKKFMSDLGGFSHSVSETTSDGGNFFTFWSNEPLLAPGETVEIDDGRITVESVDIDDLFDERGNAATY